MKHQLTFGDYINRWLFSTNAKDIAVLYFIFSLFCGILGSFMSLVLRLELAAPGNQLLMGNHQLFNVIVTAHAVLMVFFLIMPVTMGFFGKKKKGIRTIIIKSNNNNNKNKWGPYLAGLIEGDGTIVVHNGVTKVKYSPKIVITFHRKDLELANYLCNNFEIGRVNINKKGEYILWEITRIEDAYKIINLINGYFRTPKREALVRAINWINNYITQNKELIGANDLSKFNLERLELILSKIDYISILDLDNSEITSNAWLAGFTDADGHFAMSLSLNNNNYKDRVNLSYKLEIKQEYKKENNINVINNYFEIMTNIASIYNTNLHSRIRKVKLRNQSKLKLYYTYTVSLDKKRTLFILSDYFNKYPLLSSKYLDFKDWERILILGDNKGSFSDQSVVLKGKEIRTNYNKTRVNPTWIHLKNNYYEI